MTLNRSTLFALASCFALSTGCGDENEGGSDAGVGPDTGSGCAVEAKFASLHANFFKTSSCTGGVGCHGMSHQGDLKLDGDQAESFAQLTGNTFRVGADAKGKYPKRVIAGDAANSFLYVKLTVPTVPGGIMPLGAAVPVDRCILDAVEQWIKNGANND